MHVERGQTSVIVEVTEDEIREFNSGWPGSNLQGLEGVSFEFALSNGDLIDIAYANGDTEKWDGEALLALSRDAQDAAGLANAGRHRPNARLGDRDQFRAGFDAGTRDRQNRRERPLCSTRGTTAAPPGALDPVVKSDNHSFYHGYKAGSEGASSEPGAWVQYQAKHRRASGVMAANGLDDTPSPYEGLDPVIVVDGEPLWTGSVLAGAYRGAVRHDRDRPDALTHTVVTPEAALCGGVREGHMGDPYSGTAEEMNAPPTCQRCLKLDPRFGGKLPRKYQALLAKNGQSETISGADVGALPIGSILWGDGRGWVVVPGGTAPIAILPERAGSPPPAGEPPPSSWEFVLMREGTGRVPTHGTAQRHVIAWYQGQRRQTPNARGMYHDTGASDGDYVIRSHRDQLYVDRVGRGGTHTTIGSTRGFPTLKDAARAIEEDAHREDNESGIVLVQGPDELFQMGSLVKRSHSSPVRFEGGGGETLDQIEGFVMKKLARNPAHLDLDGHFDFGIGTKGEHAKNARRPAESIGSGYRTRLDQILDQVERGKREVTIDADGLTPEQRDRVIAAAKARGFHVSGTHRWLLIRNLGSGTGAGGHTANARKNITEILDAFRAGRAKGGDTCSTDGDTVYSYALPIASRIHGEVVVLDLAESPSRTTSSQIRAVMTEFPGARKVQHVKSAPGWGEIAAHRTPLRANASAGTDERRARAWMEARASGFEDRKTGEVNHTALAEAAANAVGHNEWLDDETHPIWDWAVEAGEGHELARYGYTANARRGQFKTPPGLTPAEAFFFEQAGSSYPVGSTPAQQKRAKVDGAKALAAAEAEATARGWECEWEHDFDADTSWMDEEQVQELRSEQIQMLSVLLKDENGSVLESLGGVAVTGDARRDPVVRLTEAELALEALHNEREAGKAMALNRRS